MRWLLSDSNCPICKKDYRDLEDEDSIIDSNDDLFNDEYFENSDFSEDSMSSSSFSGQRGNLRGRRMWRGRGRRGIWRGGRGNWRGERGNWRGGRGYWRGERGYWRGGRGYWRGGRGSFRGQMGFRRGRGGRGGNYNSFDRLLGSTFRYVHFQWLQQ